ncbi:rhamnan synthesis F family protein [uncultured Prochlorococcus sp.]|uniref:rhamnan synthesis F family protein n=1 Tax=uncultured Prochlorococcus sp. TaxID=159733 RepID=UPI002585A869|nr:rhamnan synthesis F family protein [uncultured Prochlorococcus sp.]
MIFKLRSSLIYSYLRWEFKIWTRLQYFLAILSGSNSINRLKDRPDIGILKNLINKNEKKRIALFVGYHKSDFIPFNNIQYVKNLINCSFTIVYIHNGKLNKEVKQTLTDMGCYVICRKNLGQDFGGWKDALFFLRKYKLDNILDWILLCNDSNFCLEGNNSENFVKRFESGLSSINKPDFLALQVNFDIHFHYQSYFLCFSRKVFKSKRFLKFWNNYMPLTNRYHAINNGEVKMSLKVLKKFKAKVLYPSYELGPEIFNQPIYDKNKLIDLLPKNLFYLESCFNKNSSLDTGIRKMMNALESYNTSHVYALYFILFSKSPFLKKDLCRMGIFTTSQIYELLKELKPSISDSFIQEIMQHYLQEGTAYSYEDEPRVKIKRGIAWDPNLQFSTRYNSKIFKEKFSKKMDNVIFEKSSK